MSTPQTIKAYLAQLRSALTGADPAMIQDALYDAEEHLRSELAENPGMSEAELLAKIANSYGAPEEVAEIYRTTEQTVARALRTPRPRPRRSLVGRFFGVGADPRMYGALFYMLLALATGIFYFTWAVTGLALSTGFAFTLIGIPFFLLFMASVRGLSLMESRIVEGMLGVRMPRRPPYPERDRPWLKRIGAMLADPRTWATLLYMLLMLPLGILYSAIVVALTSVSLALISTPILKAIADAMYLDTTSCVGAPDWVCDLARWSVSWPGVAVWCVLGILLLFATLHLVRGIGHVHGAFAKHLLVKSARV
ncbi:MAG TPA: sensor domain-containing protein [Rhodanobacteraceae bacterium]